MSILLVTIISCSQLYSIVNRLQSIIGINYQQKMEIIKELKKIVPSCPVIVQDNE
ncbi:MAG: hypothetical protein MUP85_06610 [Candidatus Lokiarchaeota archaeon]|nr:hypothetical protein [Candidatus Lokiarchaeota archaeon]